MNIAALLLDLCIFLQNAESTSSHVLLDKSLLLKYARPKLILKKIWVRKAPVSLIPSQIHSIYLTTEVETKSFAANEKFLMHQIFFLSKTIERLKGENELTCTITFVLTVFKRLFCTCFSSALKILEGNFTLYYRIISYESNEIN